MSGSSLPPELQNLEREIAERIEKATAPDHVDAFRSRVLGHVRDELRCSRARSRRSFAAAVVAAALIVANLSSSAVLVTDCGPRLADGKPSLAEMTDRIRELLPELAEVEALRHAWLLSRVSETDPQVPFVSFSRRSP